MRSSISLLKQEKLQLWTLTFPLMAIKEEKKSARESFPVQVTNTASIYIV